MHSACADAGLCSYEHQIVIDNQPDGASKLDTIIKQLCQRVHLIHNDLLKIDPEIGDWEELPLDTMQLIELGTFGNSWQAQINESMSKFLARMANQVLESTLSNNF